MTNKGQFGQKAISKVKSHSNIRVKRKKKIIMNHHIKEDVAEHDDKSSKHGGKPHPIKTISNNICIDVTSPSNTHTPKQVDSPKHSEARSSSKRGSLKGDLIKSENQNITQSIIAKN